MARIARVEILRQGFRLLFSPFGMTLVEAVEPLGDIFPARVRYRRRIRIGRRHAGVESGQHTFEFAQPPFEPGIDAAGLKSRNPRLERSQYVLRRRCVCRLGRRNIRSIRRSTVCFRFEWRPTCVPFGLGQCRRRVFDLGRDDVGRFVRRRLHLIQNHRRRVRFRDRRFDFGLFRRLDGQRHGAFVMRGIVFGNAGRRGIVHAGRGVFPLQAERESVGDAARETGEVVGHDRRDQVGLADEIGVDGMRREAGLFGHAHERRVVQSVRLDHVAGGVENGLARGCAMPSGPALPACLAPLLRHCLVDRHHACPNANALTDDKGYAPRLKDR